MGEGSAGYIVLTFKVHDEEGQYVAACDELDVASCGDTIEEAFANILDAATVYLETLTEEGEQERVFQERGITIVPGQPPHDGGEIIVRARLNEYVSPHPLPVPVEAG